jgi:hypothetical protein
MTSTIRAPQKQSRRRSPRLKPNPPPRPFLLPRVLHLRLPPLGDLSLTSNALPENYHIGLNARMWGIQDKYAHRLDDLKPGDILVLMSGGLFKSTHRIESVKLLDSRPLWPPHNGDYFQNRFQISAPLYAGEVDCKQVWNQISFMKYKEAWGGTVQGGNGVMNTRLTQADLDFIQSRMRKVEPSSSVNIVHLPAPAIRPEVTPTPVQRLSAPMSAKEPSRTNVLFLNESIQKALHGLLPQLGLRSLDQGLSQKIMLKGGAASLVCWDSHNALVVVQLHRGQASTETLLDLLFDMSQIRQQIDTKLNVRGIILGETTNDELSQIIGAVPNVSYRNYRVALELVA